MQSTSLTTAIVNGESFPLYRIMPLEILLSLLKSRKNTLVRPSRWEDPFEKIVEEAHFNYNNEEMAVDAPKFRSHSWYGQCWSKKDANDTMWRIFTPNKKKRSVKIKVSYDNLISKSREYADNPKRKNKITFFLHEVEYAEQSEEEFGKKVSSIMDDYLSQKSFLSTYQFQMLVELGILLTKRESFVYENEVRLLAYREHDNTKYNRWSYTFHFADVIDEIELDPWTPKEEIESIEESLGRFVNPSIIKPSDLYDSFEKQTKVRNITINPSHRITIMTEKCLNDLKSAHGNRP